ncbi:uncharacterized protein ARMOST_14103 [Armillaria ostoyae]|uniref:Uncharacterized protein n=1 Tax=Armillaria ostoyae TaxID=47428 RepID=A0A284RPN3_ARMOS|nr:uncharacterized protein ARMOST_14103 [Armillaria ostoyae]
MEQIATNICVIYCSLFPVPLGEHESGPNVPLGCSRYMFEYRLWCPPCIADPRRLLTVHCAVSQPDSSSAVQHARKYRFSAK